MAETSTTNHLIALCAVTTVVIAGSCSEEWASLFIGIWNSIFSYCKPGSLQIGRWTSSSGKQEMKIKIWKPMSGLYWLLKLFTRKLLVSSIFLSFPTSNNIGTLGFPFMFCLDLNKEDYQVYNDSIDKRQITGLTRLRQQCSCLMWKQQSWEQ